MIFKFGVLQSIIQNVYHIATLGCRLWTDSFFSRTIKDWKCAVVTVLLLLLVCFLSDLPFNNNFSWCNLM